MSGEYRILIVGGYGTFGGRLVELLEDDARLTLLVAGRSLARARDYCAGRSGAAATLVATQFDRINSDATKLAKLQVTIVVDASGPFQTYGDRPYGLLEYCIECGINYIDLADGSEFVSGAASFDAAARAAGVFVLSGVSSFPVLTAAVVRELTRDVARTHSIRGGIAPSPYAGVGPNVVRAIATYAGQPVPIKRGGKIAIAYPLTESMRFVIAVPGRIPLRRLRFSLVDVPDLRVLAHLWPQAKDIWMGAGPLPAVLHGLLTAVAWLVRLRLMPSLSWMSAMIYFVTNHVRWGEHRGGMFVEVRGQTTDGTPVRREWHLLAEGDHGPLIPSMAAEAIIRKALAGQAPRPGARTAIGDIELTDYEALFAGRQIFTGTRQREPLGALPLYRRILVEAWDNLPRPIQQLHSVTSVSRHSGRCAVTAGRNPIARAAARLFGFPKAGADVPIEVTFAVQGAAERWVRTIGNRTFSSTQSLPTGRSEGLIRESFGPVAVDMAVVVSAAGVQYVVRRWMLFGIPLPLWMGPQTAATESVDTEGRFCFDVRLWHVWLGTVVRYAGWLQSR